MRGETLALLKGILVDLQALLKDYTDSPNVAIGEHVSLDPHSDTSTEPPATGEKDKPPKKKKGDKDMAYGQRQQGQAKGPIGKEPENQQRQDAPYIDPRTSGALHESTSGE